MPDIRSENLSTVNKLYHFPGHDLISGQGVALGRFPLILLTDALSPKKLQLSGNKKSAAVFELSLGGNAYRNGENHESHKYSMNVCFYQCDDNSLLVYQ